MLIEIIITERRTGPSVPERLICCKKYPSSVLREMLPERGYVPGLSLKWSPVFPKVLHV